MSIWIITYSDGAEKHIEADSVSVAGTITGFLKHSKIAMPDGKIQGTPVAFVDLANPNVRLIEMVKEVEGDDAPVLTIV